MNNLASSSKPKRNDEFTDDGDEIFDDSTFLANFENTSFKKNKLSESNLNDSLNKSALNISALCCDEEISGYDKLTGQTWIYPTNYPVRDYQFNIIRAALLKNTLVSLPTGLGKTFIAAVIMYNFYRWYPLGKIVFTAPTRPLVAQQIEACYNIIAMPPNDTVEMTGHMQVNTRKTHWQSKRVFFATPQVIYNDIKSGICPGDKIRCLVIDEAHRARKNYAYCQIVSALDDMGHRTYRMLALSATPGSKIEDVVSVVNSLHIAHLELRAEDCIDVAPYSHSRKISSVIVQLGPELSQLRQQYVEILDGYARRLKQLNILPQNLGNLSKGRVVMLYKEFQTRDRGLRHPQHNYIMKDFTILIALFHGLELLVKHGSRVFLNFFDEHPEKSWIQADDTLTAFLERLRDDLGINPLSLDTSMLPDGTIPEIPKTLCFGHPKFDKLKEIMTEHFIRAKKIGQDTRAIVFCEYRESVNLVHCLLLQCRPLINSQMFVGQGASGKEGKTVVSQKQQLRVMRSFREGACNALVATCVAEEGLDVGSVDLILCFDISNRSPIRLVQRCGRTGRERGGQVFILVTEGREHQTLIDCMRQRDGLNKKILQSKEIENSLYKMNPRMMPHDFTPKCQKMHITVAKKDDPKEKNNVERKGQKDLRTMLLGRPSSSSSTSSNKETDSKLITEEEFKELFPDGYRDTAYLAAPQEYWAMGKDAFKSEKEEQTQLKLSTWLEWQRTLQKTINVGHSKDTEILSDLLQYGDAKRFEMPPSTQNPTFNTQDLATQNIITSPVKTKQPKKKQKAPITKSPAKKDGDIRALFSTATKSTKSYTKLLSDLGIQSDGSIPTSLINMLVDLNLDNTNNVKSCYICQNVCDCSLIRNIEEQNRKSTFSLMFLKDPKLPDIDLIDDFDADTILRCGKKTDEFEDLFEQNFHNESHYVSKNFNLEIDFDSPITSNSPTKLVSDTENLDTTCNFDIGGIEDIFADSSPLEAIEKEVADVENDDKKGKEALGFFGLDSIDDIFADYDDSIEQVTEIIKPNTNNEQTVSKASNNITNSPKRTTVEQNANVPNITEYPVSPSILSGRVKPIKISTSPILCSQTRKFQLSTKKNRPQNSTPVNAKKRLALELTNNNVIDVPSDKQDKSSIRNNTVDTSNKSMLTITQLVDMINKTDDGDKSVATKSTDFELRETSVKVDERSVSPILLTQTDKKKPVVNSSFQSEIATVQNKKSVSLIILDSDSDSNDTQLYNLEDEIDNISSQTDKNESLCQCMNKSMKKVITSPVSIKATGINNLTPINNKRKLEMDDSDTITSSPYFNNKKQKIESVEKKQFTLQEKVLAAVTSNKTNKFSNNHTALGFTVSQSSFFTSQKENENPQKYKHKYNGDSKMECGSKNNLEMLQMYKCDSKLQQNLRNKFDTIFNRNSPEKPKTPQKRTIAFDDSDDDFLIDDKTRCRSPRPVSGRSKGSTTNHKVRKKNRKLSKNSFLDLEAELSDDGEHDSGDELSDDSVGSIADFICDENVSNHENMHAHYLKSVRSPVKGGFKIPELPKKYDKEEVLSQFVEEDAYEMDSFCVDSHIGLTQVNDISELELAEIALEEERRAKKTKIQQSQRENDDSPLIKRRNKNSNRRIHSDSDDSS